MRIQKQTKTWLAGTTALVVLSGAGAMGTARAQDTGASAELPEITVFGAAREERALHDTPNAVTVIDEAEIRRRQPSTYEELIGDVPGVTIDGGPRGIAQEPNIRGFQDEQVIIRLDGGRQNFDLAHRGRFFTDPSIVKEVEILRGGQSTLFGSGALGGVIFVDTKDAADILDPGQTVGGEVKVGYNSQGNQLLGAATGAVQAGDFDLLTFYAGRPMFDNLTDGSDVELLDSDIDSHNGLLKFGWEPGDGHRVEASYQLYTDGGDTPTNANAASTDTTVVGRDLTYHTGRLGWDWSPADNPLINISTLAYINDAHVEEDRIFDGRFDETDFRTIGFEASNIAHFDLGPVPSSLALGVEVFQDTQEATRDGAARLSTPDAERRFYAVFAQADFEVLPGVTITPGVRYDRFDLEPEGAFADRSEDQVSPKLTVNWRPTPEVQVFGGVSQSFRAPSLTELYTDGVHFATQGFALGGPGAPVFTGVNEFVPAPDLKPERATQFEFGARYETDSLLSETDRLSLSGNIYYSRVKDYVDQTVTFLDFDTLTFNPNTFQLEVSGTTTLRNVDAELYGMEAEVDYDAGVVFGSAGLTIPRGRIRNSGGALGSIPQDRLVLTAGFRPIPDVEIGMRGTLTRGIDADDVPAGSLTTPGYGVLDIFATWEPSDGPLEGAVFAAGIDNVADKTYRIHPNGLNDPGLAVKLSAGYRF